MDYKYIEDYTKIYDDHKKLIDNLCNALGEFRDHQKDFEKLESYYYSEQFHKDYDASNRGEIKGIDNLGILTEDAIYDLLGDNYYMARELLDMANYIIQDKEK